MAPITEALLRKRSEHNDGLLTDVQEIALHQEEIECIPPTFQTLCRHLRILLLQNNVISKIENLNKLKELEYLNLALNSIGEVENLGRCESLKKLDLTVNFIDLDTFRESVLNLADCSSLEDLYLVGNPCMQWESARPYIVGHIPWLKQLDGTLVTPSERLQAKRALPRLEAELRMAAEQCHAAKQQPDYQPVYSREERLNEYRELAKQKAAKETAKKEEQTPKIPLSVHNARGDIRQCNEGKYEFVLDDWSSGSEITLTVQVPKFMDTSQIDVDVHPNYVRCVVKGKVLQLVLSEEVKASEISLQRARTTGELKIRMPRVKTFLVPTTSAGAARGGPVKDTVSVVEISPACVRRGRAERVSADSPPPLERVN